MRIGLIFGFAIFLVGCSAPTINTDKNEILKLIEKKDKEIEKLNAKIADLEAKKQKYKEDLELYNNNPVLDELDELLSSKDAKDTNDTTQE